MEARNYVSDEINKRIKELTDKKAGELFALQAEIDKASAAEEAAENNMKTAMEEMNLKAYTTAKSEQLEARTAKEMYTARYNQLQAKDFVTEQESDEVIKSLLDQEAEMATEYEEEAQKLLDALRDCSESYFTGVKNTEATINAWTSQIHDNYLSEGTTYKDGTNRSPVPVPVHRATYNGCDLSVKVRTFLKTIE